MLYVCNIYAFRENILKKPLNTIQMENENLKKKSFDPQESISRAKTYRISKPKWHILSEGNEYIWTSKLERVATSKKAIQKKQLKG